MQAAHKGQARAVKSLLKAGAAIHAKNNEGWTALWLWAVAGNGKAEIAASLLGAGADPNAKDNNGWTALWMAADHGRSGAVKAILRAGAAVNAQDRRVRAPADACGRACSDQGQEAGGLSQRGLRQPRARARGACARRVQAAAQVHQVRAVGQKGKPRPHCRSCGRTWVQGESAMGRPRRIPLASVPPPVCRSHPRRAEMACIAAEL